jgi:hypothetical protein
MEVKRFVSGKKDLEVLFEALSQTLLQFRNTHLKIVAAYIAKPAKDAGMSAGGTGGTDALSFLKEIRNDMRNL